MSQSGSTRVLGNEPYFESENAEERIAARRRRIAARIEAKMRQALGDDSLEKKEMQQEARESQKQVEQSEMRMIKLTRDGTELVTNIQVTADFRESQRRAAKEEARRHRIEKLESEAKSSLEKFEEITKKWTMARQKVIPQELRDALSSQQKLCGLLIEDKNKLINDLQQELKECEDRYVKDLKKQAEDVDLMVERMEDQIKNSIKSYREELDQIENAFERERKTLLQANRKKWEQMMDERRDKEKDNLMQRMKRVQEYEVLLKQLRTGDAEEYNVIKSKLDKDVQVLEQQLQQTKATYQLNQEKLEYNFQVLKKRDEENTVTKSQQKRKITRLQDVLSNLKIKFSKQEKQFREENQSLTDDYKRTMQQYKHMQKKMKHLVAIDMKKFEEIWLMNEAEVKALVEKALEADRLVHEQQLGLAWVRPPLPFMERSEPVASVHRSPKSDARTAAELLKPGGPREEGPSSPTSDSSQPEGNTEHSEISPQTVKRLLELLCDETGFLIESKLLKLLSPLEKDEQSLMKLDSIFSALQIENQQDLYKLANFFVKYKHQKEPEEGEEFCSEEEEEHGEDSRAQELIHPNDVLPALLAFTAEHCQPRGIRQSNTLSLQERDDSGDAAYWESMANVIPESKLKVWDALESALEKYHTVLNERSKVLLETQSLQQQNTELRMLLHQHVNSRVNAELEIPPTQVTQLGPGRFNL